jgi:RNA polymerase sigma-70 factor, ECF subfamily
VRTDTNLRVRNLTTDLVPRPPAQAEASRDFGEQVVEHLPQLRAFARGLTGHRETADDLVHDAVVRALAAEHQFTPGTNLRAWLFTILRNVHHSHYRRRKLDGGSIDDLAESQLASPPQQLVQIELKQVQRLLQQLPVKFREALLLVSAAGMSYEEAAAVCGCAVGTTKSRVNRARKELIRLKNAAPGLPAPTETPDTTEAVEPEPHRE